MAYAILRTQKLKTPGNCGGLNHHLERKMEVPNADRELTYLNYRRGGSGDLVKDVANRLQQAGVEKPRKNAVLAIEHLMTASPEAFRFQKTQDARSGKPTLTGSNEDIQRWNAFVKGCQQWLGERYGADNVVNVTVHLDEQTPHIHAVVVPIDGKGKLNCRHFLGGREKMRAMQDSFAQVHQELGLERGIEGSKAHHTTVKQFYTQVQQFDKTPSLELGIDAPVASIQPPETNFMRMMVETPASYVERQQKRLNELWQTQQKDNLRRAQQKALELHQAAKAGEVLKLENERVKGQLKGLQGQVSKLNTQVEMSRTLLKALMNGQLQAYELIRAQQQLPSNDREKQIHQLMKQVGLEVKTEEKKQENKVYRGPKL